jgi:hypothetical protein
MAQTWRFYIVTDSGDVSGTNDFEVAAVAKRDGTTLVIEPKAAEATFDGDTQMIEETDPEDYTSDDDSDEDDEGDD